MIGEKYGRLTVKEKSVIYTSPKGKRFQKWKCECECGNIVDVTTSALRGRAYIILRLPAKRNSFGF